MLTSFPELQFKWAWRGTGKFLTSCWAATKLLVHTERPYLENHRFIQRWVTVSLGKRIHILFHISQNLLSIPHFTKNTQDSMTVSPRAVKRPREWETQRPKLHLLCRQAMAGEATSPFSRTLRDCISVMKPLCQLSSKQNTMSCLDDQMLVICIATRVGQCVQSVTVKLD